MEVSEEVGGHPCDFLLLCERDDRAEVFRRQRVAAFDLAYRAWRHVKKTGNSGIAAKGVDDVCNTFHVDQ